MVDRGDTDAVPSAAPGDDAGRLEAFFDAAIDEVYPYLLRRCGDRATAEDLTQDTFVTAVNALRADQVDRLTIGWLIRCAQSRFIDHCRREDRRNRHLTVVASTETTPIDDAVIGEVIVAERLAELPANQRLVVVLHHLDGLTVPDIAKRLGRSVRSVESLLARARRAMRQREGDQDGR